MNASKPIAMTLLAAVLQLSPEAAGSPPSGVQTEIKREMAKARQEVRVEMAKARIELDSEDLSLDRTLRFGKDGRRQSRDSESLPAAQITPKGDFLIDGTAVAINLRQRRQLLDYRGRVIDLAKAGIDGGERVAMAALEATDVSLFRLIVGGLSGSLERRVEASVKQHLEPLVQQICQRLPQLLESQQELATSLPQFQPYANLDHGDVDDCEDDIRRDFAAL